MSRELNLSVTVGCTLQSGKIFSIEESIPVGTTYDELMQGIDLGIYTKKSLVGKTYQGQVRDRANAHLRGELICTVANDELVLSLSAITTGTWDNEASTFFYDVFETDTNTGVVIKAIYGKIEVIPAITIEA